MRPLLLALLASSSALAAEVPLDPTPVPPVDCGLPLDVSHPTAHALREAWCITPVDPKQALSRLDGVDGPAPLDGFVRLARARAHVAAGAHEPAVAALGGPLPPGDAGVRARLLRARALVRLGRSLEARDDLRDLLDTPVGEAARWWLAVGGRDRGATEAAIATFRRLWIDSVRGPWSALAAEQLAALGAPVSDVTTPEGRATVTSRIEALQRAHQHEAALPLLLALHGAAPGTVSAWELGTAHFRVRDYDAAEEHFREALGAPEEARGTAAQLFRYALTVARTGDYPTAATVYARLQQQHPHSDEADEASYKQAYMAWDEGRVAWHTAGDPAPLERAILLFGRHLHDHPRTDHLESTLWFQGWSQWTLGQRDAALETWARLEAARPRSGVLPGIAYWRARKLGIDGDASGEREALEALLHAHPASGHAWLAAERLGTSFPARPEVARPPWPAPDATLQAVDALLAHGLHGWASDLLDTVEAPLRRTADGRLALAWARLEAGEVREARALVSSRCTPAHEPGEALVQPLCFPRPQAVHVTRNAVAWRLPPLLPYGIMWSESAMKPGVTSYAGARGLMQIMPAELARLQEEAERSLGSDLGTADPDRLYAPSYNAIIGVTELGTKAAALEAQLTPANLPAVIASYNGGEAAVRRWVEELGGAPAPFDVFAEDISYTQTRRYVRGVLGHLMAYRWVYGDPVSGP